MGKKTKFDQVYYRDRSPFSSMTLSDVFMLCCLLFIVMFFLFLLYYKEYICSGILFFGVCYFIILMFCRYYFKFPYFYVFIRNKKILYSNKNRLVEALFVSINTGIPFFLIFYFHIYSLFFFIL